MHGLVEDLAVTKKSSMGGVLLKNALLIVDRDFTTSHVGVKRVIQKYWNDLENLGYEVHFGTFINGTLVSLKSAINTNELFEPGSSAKDQKKFWSKGDDVNALVFTPSQKYTQRLKWSKSKLDPSRFDVSLVTNPWVLSHAGAGDKDLQFTFAVVLDMVPNLISLGRLVFEKWVDAFAFAEEHRKGYEYMIKNVSRVLAISESTKKDFLELTAYPESRVTTVVPFRLEEPPIRKAFRPGTTLKVSMVNALDHRKNFTTAAQALVLACEKVPIDLTIVGRERVSSGEVKEFLKLVSEKCNSVVWYREANDEKLNSVMNESDLIFFPSKYEGLGLPILESQSRGIPVLSDTVSSCGEFNLNSNLTVTSGTAENYARAIVSFWNQETKVMRGFELASAQIELLNKYPNIVDLV